MIFLFRKSKIKTNVDDHPKTISKHLYQFLEFDNLQQKLLNITLQFKTKKLEIGLILSLKPD